MSTTTDIIQVASSGKADRVLLDLRVRSLYSPYFFAKTILQYSKLVPHLHQHDLELFVSRWARGQCKQFIEWPRAFYKTTTFTISCGIWGVLPVRQEDTDYALDVLHLPEDEWFLRAQLHDQDATQLFAFETMDNAKRKLAIIKWHFEENALFRAVFPDIAYTGEEKPWNSESMTIRRVGARKKDAEATFEAIGVGNALQSRHYSRIWCDDLVGERARKSQIVMEDTFGWYGRLAGAHENVTRKVQFGVSNRWGYADLNSFIRMNEPDVVFYTRAAWERNEYGEDIAIFPEEYSIEALLKIREKEGMTKYDFSCQYLNSPIMPGEREVATEGIHYYTVDSDNEGRGQIKCSCGKAFFPSQLNRYIHYDPYNSKGAGSTSCPALVCVGTSTDEHIFLLDYFLGKESYGKIYERLFRFNDIWLPQVFTYEDVGHQNLTEFHIREIEKTSEFKSKHRRFPRIEGVSTGGRSKEVRIRQGLFPAIENKKFAVRKTQQTFLQMLETFPNKVFDHDYDLLDALAQGSDKWRFPLPEDYMLAEKTQDEEYLAGVKPYSAGVRV